MDMLRISWRSFLDMKLIKSFTPRSSFPLFRKSPKPIFIKTWLIPMKKERVYKMRESIFVSSCLLSKKCLYHGFLATFAKERIEELRKDGYKILDACPEMLGGLPCPRPPARFRDMRVMAGRQDVTAIFMKGADLAMRIIDKERPLLALLLKNSPMCDPNFGIFGRRVAFKLPTIDCNRKNDWLQRLALLLGRDPSL